MLVGLEEEKAVIKSAIESNEAVLIIGETGVGKTSMIREMAKEANMVFRRLNLNGSTGVEEFIGKVNLEATPEGGTKTTWHDGVLIEAMKKGEWLLVDEINAALPEILFVLQSLLDDDRYVVLADKNGEIIRPHKDFRFFAAMNPPAEYAGTKKLNKALLSRFGVVLKIESPDLALMQKIVASHVALAPELNESICKIADHVNKSHTEGNTDFYCSIRDLISFAKLLKAGSSPETAFTLSVLNKSEPYEEEAIRAIASMYIQINGKPKPLTKEEEKGRTIKALYEGMEEWNYKAIRSSLETGVKLGAVEMYNMQKKKLNKDEQEELGQNVRHYLDKFDSNAALNRRAIRDDLKNRIEASCPK